MRGISKRKLAAAAVIALAAVGAAALLYQPALAWYRRLAKLPDENGIYQVGDHWFEALEPVEDSAADAFAAKLQTLQGMLSPDNRVYWALVPDKGWYVRQEGYPTLDHEAFQQRAAQQLAQSGMTAIDLSGALQLDSYLRTDRHWRQDALQPVLDTLGEAMDFAVKLEEFTPHTAEFSGDLVRKLPRPAAEQLVWLTSDATDDAQVDNYKEDAAHMVYDTAKLDSSTPYGLFLSGITPYLTIESPQAETDRQLVIFGDSFASSLAPLLCESYSRITIFDLRFIHSSLVKDYIEFSDQDVLFLYSDWIASNSALLR